MVDSEVALWLTRMSELSRFVYIRSHVSLHVKSNAKTVNYMKDALEGEVNMQKSIMLNYIMITSTVPNKKFLQKTF